MRTPVGPRRTGAVLVLPVVLLLAACDLTELEGACVSDPVEFTNIGDRVFCYDGWERLECEEYDAEQVNGTRWTFHEGQSCLDRDLDEGSNPYP